MKLTWRKFLLEAVAYSVALMIIMSALFVSIAHLIVPVLNQHKPQFENIASHLVGSPVTIQKVQILWSHLEPVLSFVNVNVLDSKTQKPRFEVPEIRANMQIWRSILTRKVIFESLKITGVHLTLREMKDDRLKVEGFGDFSLTDNITGQAMSPNAILAWIFSQSHLILQNISILYSPLNGEEKTVALDRLVLKNSNQHHTLMGQAILVQEVPTKVDINFNWNGDLTNLAQVKAHLYLYLEAVSLPQWFSHHTWRNLRILQGMGSTKIWAEWSNNVWQKVQAEFQFYDLQSQSIATKKDIFISRMSGHLGWKRDGASEVLAGENILIDLPNHLWPTDNFTVKYKRDENAVPVVEDIHLGYLDLGDTDDLIHASDILPLDFTQWLTTFDPEGELHDVNINYSGAMTDASKVTLSGEFSQLSMNAWGKFPGITNFHGKLIWNGKQGSLKLDSQQATVTMDKVFENPLQFDQLTGELNWQSDTQGGWNITANNLYANNLDLTAKGQFTLNLPAHDSPVIDLTGNFAVANAAHVSAYLPLKIFERDLIEWLQQAFLGGEITDGKAILNGRLTDFPFDHNNGTFMISGSAKDADLNFAPHWPEIRKINGKLIFAGRSLTIDITSGKIFDVPIGSVHAVIPYLGDAKPQILEVSGQINADLAQGLHFIQSSPLQKTLGQDLKAMQLQGAMQLKLDLSVPLRKPENTKVVGDTVVTNATMLFPDWNLSLNQLKGGFQFTEESITAKNITGELFTKPVVLTLVTQDSKNKQSVVKASVAGQIDLTDLQAWLKLPLDQFMQGQASFQADLTLPPHTQKTLPTEVVIHSDLQGIQINLPAGLGKNGVDKKDFQLLLDIKEGQPLKTKLTYDKLLSAALTLQNENQKMQLVSGELHLGNKSVANWQTQPGIIVTGDFDTVDWKNIQPYIEKFSNKSTAQSTDAQNSLFDPSLLRGADLQIHKLIFPSLQLDDIRVQLTKNINTLTIGLENANMNGQIILPMGSGGKVQAKFQRLNISAQSGNGKSTLSPSALPPISFVCDDLRYGAASLGHLTLDLTPNKNGVSIMRLDLDSSSMTLRSTGYWQGSTSHLQGSLETSHLNRLLSAWGFEHASLVGSNGNANFDLTWQGAPFQPSLSTMSGTVALKLGEGRIINLSKETDAEMGFGRMLNVFSLQTIPRRLSLDFSDLFENGYTFDSVKGDFTLKNGNALTHNTRFDGPVARVDINGRLGLANKDYDMKLDVTPYVTASLPVVTAIATANPVAGVAAWLIDKAVSRGVSKINTYHYTITGPWDQPVWTRMDEDKKAK